MTINVHFVQKNFFFRKNNIRIEFVRCLVGCWAIDYFHSKWQLRQFQHFVHLLSLKQHLFSSQLEISRALNGQTAENQHISRGSIFKLKKKWLRCRNLLQKLKSFPFLFSVVKKGVSCQKQTSEILTSFEL